MRLLLAALFVAFPLAASAEAASATAGRGTDWIAIGMFVAIDATLIITYRSAGSTKSKADFYSAGHSITPLQNGLAIARDFLSAARSSGYRRWSMPTALTGFFMARLSRGLADRSIPDVGAPAQFGQLYFCRRRGLPARSHTDQASRCDRKPRRRAVLSGCADDLARARSSSSCSGSII